MAKRKNNAQAGDTTGATVGDDRGGVTQPLLWRMADALRGSMDAAEYKHVVLGLIPQWRPAKMNLAVWRIDAQIVQGASFGNDRFQDLERVTAPAMGDTHR